MYTLFVEYRDGTVFELPYLSSSYDEEQNKGKSARFMLDYLAVEDVANAYGTTVDFMLTGGYREIYIQKDTTKIYYGVISDYAVAKESDGKTTIQLASVDFFALLAKRIVGAKRTFTATEASEIAWTLIDESQSSDPDADLGITQGTTTTSKNRDKTFRFATVKEAIEYISNFNLKDGFDFDINTLKQFNAYYPEKGSQRANIVLDEENILSWSWRKPLTTTLTNKVYVLGEGFNDDVQYITRESDTSYKEAFTLLEDVLQGGEVSDDTLDDKGDRHLLKYQAPISELVLTLKDDDPDILEYDLGDSLKIKIAEIGLDNVYRRVYKRSVSIENQLAVVRITLR